MSQTSFLSELEARPWLLADGATGTNLFEHGLMSGDAPELWNFEHPDRIARAAPGLRRCRRRHHPHQFLRRHPPPAEAAQCRRTACMSSTGAPPRSPAPSPTSAGRQVIVAGSVGPTGELFEPLGAADL